MNIKHKIINSLWVVGVLLIAGFCLSACSTELDIQQAYPFRVETMPVPKEIKVGESLEIRCTLIPEGYYTDTRYTLRFFQYEGVGILQIGKDGEPLIPNDRYAVYAGDFNLYYISKSTERQSLEIVIEDNHGQSQVIMFDFNNKQVEEKE